MATVRADIDNKHDTNSSSGSNKAVAGLDPANTKLTEKVRLATFQRCNCIECPKFPAGEGHLSIATEEVELRMENGVAISYTWGEFGRAKHFIGHRNGHPAAEVLLELGAEWRIASVVERLAQFTEQWGACWVDQVCIPQKTESIRKTLAQIPTIFKTLPVIMLLPGSLCSCLKKAWDACSDAEAAEEIDLRYLTSASDIKSARDSHGQSPLLDLFAALSATKCLNSNGACSWPHRIWTSQEYRFARFLKLVHANPDVAKCCIWDKSSVIAPQDLNDFARLLHAKVKADFGLDNFGALGRVAEYNYRFSSNLNQQRAWKFSQEEKSDHTLVSSWAKSALLLLGKCEMIAEDSRFIDVIQSVCLYGLSATQPKDYVLSVWTEWEFYKIPQDFENLSPTRLLADAMRQLYSAWNFVVPTTCPAGLLGSKQQTAALSPYFEASNVPIKDSRQLYDLFKWTYRVTSPSFEHLPLKVLDTERQSCGSSAQSLDSWLSNIEFSTILVWACCSCNNFESALQTLYDLKDSPPSFARLAHLLSSNDTSEQIQGCKQTVVLLIYDALMHHRTELEKIERSVQTITDKWQADAHSLPDLVKSLGFLLLTNIHRESGFEFDVLMAKLPIPVYGEVFFEIFCGMLSLDTAMCRAKGVKAMIDESHELEEAGEDSESTEDDEVDRSAEEAETSGGGGLNSNDEHLSGDEGGTVPRSRTCIGLVHWATFCQARLQGQNTMTVASDRPPHTPLYEVIGDSLQSKEWRVVGVWVPLKKKHKVSEVGALIVNEDKADAFIL